MPKGFYPADHKHEKARGLSRNKYDTKGELRKARKSRAKDPERFKKAIEEKTGLSGTLYKDSLLGKIVHKGIASGNIDEDVAKYTSLKPKTDTKLKDVYDYYIHNPFRVDETDEEQRRHYEFESRAVEENLGRYYTPQDSDERIRLTGNRREIETTYTPPSIKSVEDINSREIMTNYFNEREFRHDNKMVIPTKHRKALREYIKKEYADEYGVNREGKLVLRTKARAKNQAEKDMLEQQRIDYQNQQINDLFGSIEAPPVDRNANVSLQQANIQMKIAERLKPLRKAPPPPKMVAELKQVALKKALRSKERDFKQRVKDTLYAFTDDLPAGIYTDPDNLVDTRSPFELSHLIDNFVPIPPKAGLAMRGENIAEMPDTRWKEKGVTYPDEITQSKGEEKKINLKVRDKAEKEVQGLKPTSLPTLGNPLPSAIEYKFKVDKGEQIKIRKTKRLKKKLKIVLPPKEEEESEPSYMMDSDETNDSDFEPVSKETETEKPKTKRLIKVKSRWTAFQSGWSKGYPKGMTAKESKFLTLSEAKAEAKKRGPKVVRAITKQKYGKRVLYTLRGSGHLNKATEKGEMTMLYK